jgi:phosphatidylserine/phosphatidylglycerophosphate/cardiolipin synthase-like enzyme
MDVHQKFAVMQRKLVTKGSLNLSPSAALAYDETPLVIELPQVTSTFHPREGSNIKS